MSDMLVMAALEFGDPVLLVVLVKASDASVHRGTCSEPLGVLPAYSGWLPLEYQIRTRAKHEAASHNPYYLPGSTGYRQGNNSHSETGIEQFNAAHCDHGESRYYCQVRRTDSRQIDKSRERARDNWENNWGQTKIESDIFT